jgi:hypothetical protein
VPVLRNRGFVAKVRAAAANDGRRDQHSIPHAFPVFAALCDRFPLLPPTERRDDRAIGGNIYAQPGYQPVCADGEVHRVPRTAGH